jgi:hypothetical protein
VARLPTAVSLLLLEALFMQISGVSLALTWPHRLCFLRVLLCVCHCYMLSPFQAHWEVTLHPLSQVCVFIYSSCRMWVFPTLLWSFPPTATFTSFPAPDCWVGAAAPASRHVCLQFTWEVGLPSSPVEFSSLRHSHKLSHSWLLGTRPGSHPLQPDPACLFTDLGGISLPSTSALSAPHPLCYVSLLFLLLITQFLFFPQVGLVCPRGYAALAQGCLWEYRIPLSSPCGPRLPNTSGAGNW